LWNVSPAAAGQLLATAAGHRKAALCVCWSDDSSKLASGSEDKTVRVWSVPRRLADLEHVVEIETSCRLKGHEEAVVSCCFAP
jgi:WD40 repeat protein